MEKRNDGTLLLGLLFIELILLFYDLLFMAILGGAQDSEPAGMASVAFDCQDTTTQSLSLIIKK